MERVTTNLWSITIEHLVDTDALQIIQDGIEISLSADDVAGLKKYLNMVFPDL